MKLSLIELADELVWHAEHPVQGRLTELAKLAANELRSLAQQAQPLTDEMISAEAIRIGGDVADVTYPNVRGTVVSALHEIATWARDRMAQQAQPEPHYRDSRPGYRVEWHCIFCSRQHGHDPECADKIAALSQSALRGFDDKCLIPPI
jgi:hypothetical protein